MTTTRAIGQSVVRGEGPDKVTGKSVYAADVTLPGMLRGKALRSPFPHARIVSIDTEQAKAVPGVHAVITAADLPGSLVGRRLRDLPVLARDVVRFVGEKVAAVAAETQEAVEEALLLIDVEYEELPAVFDAHAAMEPNAPTLHPDMSGYEGLPQPESGLNNVFAHITWGQGDVEQGFAEADLVFEHTFNAQLMHQAYIEPHACVVSASPPMDSPSQEGNASLHSHPQGRDTGEVDVWVNNKDPYALREQLAAVWGMDEERIVLHPCSIGGDFGGKGSFMDVPLCYYLSLHSGRPVKMVMDYIQELMAANPRHPAAMTIRSGVKRDGTLVARQARVVFDSGGYGAFKPTVYLRGADHLCGVYRIPHARIDSYMVYTNNVPKGHMRSPAKPQVVFAVEAHTDLIAREMGIDPYQFRQMNLLRDGDASPVGHVWQDIRAEETLRRAADAIGWGEHHTQGRGGFESRSYARPCEGTLTGRGLAITDLSQGVGRFAAKISMNSSGRPTLHMAFWDTGTGSHTVLRQMVAQELSVPVDEVDIELQDTSEMPFSSGSGGTRVTYTAGQAVVGAARELRRKLIREAAPLLDSPEEDVSLQSGRVVVGPSPLRPAYYRTINIGEVVAHVGDGTIEAEYEFASEPPDVTSFCAQAAEVEVDPETGQITVTRFVTAHDVGAILNPLMHQGQVEGGVIQGLGYALMEELLTEDGHISTLSFGDYKIPTSADVPELVTVLVEGNSGPAPYRSKGIGESANIPVAAAIANAVTDAIGVPVTSLPLTAEKALRAIRSRGREG